MIIVPLPAVKDSLSNYVRKAAKDAGPCGRSHKTFVAELNARRKE
jgi:hypothetical protein